MGAVSIWHWLLVLMFVVPFTIGVVILGIVTASKTCDLGRMAYVMRIGAAFSLSVLIGALMQAVLDHGSVVHAVAIIGFVASCLASLFLYARWSVHRLRNAGWSPWLGILVVVPFVNLLTLLFLCLLPPSTHSTEEL